MFAGFRKHQKWVWLIAIIVVIPSFVVFFSPDAKWSRGRGGAGGGSLGTINGRTVSREELIAARAEAHLSYFFRTGNWPGKDEASRQYGFDDERDTLGRLVLNEKLRDLQVHVGMEATVAMAGELLERIAGGKPASAELFDAFTKQVLAPNGLTKGDFERFVQHEVGIQHLISVAGLGGRLVTPQEAETIYRRENEELSVDAVFFSNSNYLASVTTATPEALGRYYTNNQAAYRLPERVQVSYVKYEMTNFLADADAQLGKITNLAQRIDALYLKRGTNFYTDAAGKPLDAASAQARIKQELREELAIASARKKAYETANQLAEKNPANLAAFSAVAEANKLAVKTTEPFDEDGPKSLKVQANFAKAAFLLTAAEPVSISPLVGEDGVYLIALKEKFPSAVSPLATVRARVEADYRLAQATEMVRDTISRTFHTTLTNGLKAGKTFTTLCLDGKLKPVSLPPFSRSTRTLESLPEKVSLGEVKRVVFNLKPGEVSPVVPTADGTMILFLRSRFPVDAAKMKTDLPNFLSMLRYNRQFEAADAWLQKQRQQMQVDVPALTKSKDKKS